jgi:ATP-dependent DNA ligase
MSLTLGPLFNTQNGKVRIWSIQISLFNSTKCKIAIPGNIENIENVAIYEDYYATYSTISGYDGMKMTQSAETIIRCGKHLGKKNQTNVLTQALKECQSKYAAKIHSGYTKQSSAMAIKSSVPFPMALKSWKDHKKKLVYPVYVQPKLDGVRMLAVYECNDVKFFTRRLHEIVGFDDIKQSLKKMFQMTDVKNRSFIIDGELYAHGVNLQTISGIVRNEAISEHTKSILQYHVFDCFTVIQPSLDFPARHEILTTIVNAAPSNFVILTPTILAATSTQADNYYKKVTNDGYEGIIYKSRGKKYEFDFNKEKRSMFYLKRKKQADAEYTIIGFTEGKGKDIGCIVFTLETSNGKTFNCVPNGTYIYRRQLYDLAKKNFDIHFKKTLAKVAYDDLSADLVPLRGRIVQIGRDLSFD